MNESNTPTPKTFQEALLLAKLPEPSKNLSVSAYKEFPAERVSEEVIVVGYEKGEFFHATAVCMAPDLTSADDFRQLLANARLYAAAPELLEEYERLLQRLKDASENCFLGYSSDAENLAHEMADFKSPAIAKARGSAE